MYETLIVHKQEFVTTIQMNRPQANNAINRQLVLEFREALDECIKDSTVVVLEGLQGVFSFGADFDSIRSNSDRFDGQAQEAEKLYEIWLQLATGPFVSIAHVRGKANAGGVGFVAACDIVIADETATFSLSELLFGIYPACVLPFLVRKVGVQKANYLTLSTQSISVQKAHVWGLVDVYDSQSHELLRKHLLRLRRLSKVAIGRYKSYMSTLKTSLIESKRVAVLGNQEVFGDPNIIEGIERYINHGIFPWEA